MPIESLSINRFRNLRPVELQFSPKINLFVGENASGKTSLLEALFLLARGRSFRTSQLDKLIQHGYDDFLLVAQQVYPDGRRVPVGVRRTRGRLECRIDGRPAKRLSELAALFPIQWLGGNLHTLIEDGPARRRQFLDWGLFHVKPDYIVLWKRFQKLLKQRNAALRTGAGLREIQAWHPELAETGEQLHRFRSEYLHALAAVFTSLTPEFAGTQAGVALSYQKGWRKDVSYLESLNDAVVKDRDSGYTRTGPQRAEVYFTIDDQTAEDRLSRGQQKVFITALQLAQAAYLHTETGKTSLFLLDDLGAELDITNQRIVLGLLASISAQIFVTAIEEPVSIDDDVGPVSRFHVEHGVLSEMV